MVDEEFEAKRQRRNCHVLLGLVPPGLNFPIIIIRPISYLYNIPLPGFFNRCYTTKVMHFLTV